MKPISMKAVYSQQSDEMQPVNDADQMIEISTEDAGAGTYFVIKTNRWAFDNPEELMKLIKDFEKRIK